MATTPKRRSLEKTPKMDVSPFNAKFVCVRCGTAYGRQKGVFPVSHSPMYRGSGYLPWCNECIDKMYEEYRQLYRDDRLAMRRMCMKMDLYWNAQLYESVERTAGTQSRVRSYIAKSNIIRYIDKTFDDTIAEEGDYGPSVKALTKTGYLSEGESDFQDVSVPEEAVLFWGPGYTPTMYMELEQRRKYWMSRLGVAPDKLDIGTEALVRQICNIEIDINHDRAAGRAVDKGVTTLNTLLGSLNLKPVQKQNDADGQTDNTPFGVWIRRFENERPIPEVDPEMKDVDGIARYISIWFLGHLCKMLGIKNGYYRLYEEEIAKMRVELPEYDDEDDESMLNDIFSSGGAEEAGAGTEEVDGASP